MIETGRLILTMMPSLYCKLDCPHCYLTKEQRKSKACLTLEQIKITVEKIKDYYHDKDISNVAIDIYWYGGEPTTMGVKLFSDMCDIINSAFEKYKVRHTLLSALIGVDLNVWIPVINKYCNGMVQTSYDSLMRGVRYDEKWQKQVQYLVAQGLKVSTLSVFNELILKDGANNTWNKLSNLGISQTGWLPFQKNTRNNATGMFIEHSTSMNEFSDFMIEFNQLNQFKKQGNQMLINNELFINSMDTNGTNMSNTGAQTVFLMPNGDMVMPDYDKDNVEYMRPFGNILTQSFGQVLTSQSRRDWIRRQINRNNNPECLKCDSWDCCLMEFWKNNSKDDDCYGAKRYVDWVKKSSHQAPTLIENIA